MSVRTDVVNLIVNVGGDAGQNELNQLRKKAADLSAEMKGLSKSTAEYKTKAAELKDVENQMAALRKQIGLSALTQKELVAELKRLQALKNITTPQTREFHELEQQIGAVRDRLYDVRNGVFGFQSVMHRIGDEVKAFGVMAAGYLGFEFLSEAFKNIISGAGNLSDALADVRRVTGLSQTQVESLNQSLRNIDTRTANSQLLEYAKIAGKLGIASKDIEDFVKATDMLVTALGDELGDANVVTENIGKIINIYDKGAQITGERTLQIGNAIVDLANKGVASGNFIVDFTKRLAGIANTANVSLEASIGLAAGLEELGQTSESSSTAVTQLISKIGQDIPKYAALAGKSAAEFGKTLKEKPVEALIQLGEGLTKNKKGFAEISTAFKEAEASGVRVTSTLGVIGQKADFLRGKIADAGLSLTNTTQITEAYALKNETLGSTLEKITKRLGSMFTSSNFVSGIKSALVSFAELIGAVEKTDTALESFRAQTAKVASLDKSMTPLIDRIETLAKQSNLSKTEQIELNTAIDAVAKTIPYAVTEFDKYGRVLSISTDKAREYVNMQKIILKEKNRAAIQEEKDKIAKLEKDRAFREYEVKVAKEQMKTTMFLYKSGVPKSGFSGGLGRNEKDIEQAQNNINKSLQTLQEIEERIQGSRGIIAELSGSALDQDLKNAEARAAQSADLTEQTATAEIKTENDKQKKIDELRQRNIEAQQRLHEKLLEMRTELDAAMKSKDDEELARLQIKYSRLLKEAKNNAQNIQLINELHADEITHINVTKWRKQEMPARLEMYAEVKKIDDDGNKGILARLKKSILDQYAAIKAGYENRTAQRKKELKETIDATLAIVSSSMNALSDMANLVNTQEDNLLNQELARNEKRKASYDKMLKSKQISQATYNREVAALDKESDDRKKEISKRQAQRAKELAIAQAVINAALGITQIWATYAAAPYVAAALTAIQAIATGIQIATIASQEIPEGRKGLVINGPSHEDGGIDMVDTRTGNRIANIEGGEPVMVLSKNTYGNNKSIIDELIYNSQNKNGAPINPKWTSTYSKFNSNLVQTMSKGGTVGSFGQSMSMQETNSLLSMLIAQQRHNTDILQRMPTSLKAKVVLKDIHKADDTMAFISKESGLKQTNS